MITRTLQDIAFPLVKRPVFAILGNGKQIDIPGKIVLMNSQTDQPISIVSNSYELITNEEAYNYGKNCMKTLFNITNDTDIELFNIIAPDKNSFCHIDLTSPKSGFDIFDEKYLPFIRITNSYNTSFKLSFKIGVCRWICKNGMIFGEDAIKFNYNHVKGAKKEINFEVRKDEFNRTINDFKSDVQILKDSDIAIDYSFLIFCKALGLTFDINNSNELKKDKARKKLSDYQSQFNSVLNKYTKELGKNYYALYNTITEFSTNGFADEPSPVLRINSWQRRAGYWLSSFTDLLRNENIDFDEYLEEYLELSKN